MAFDKEWNETTPAGTENPKQGDDRIREFKEAIRERLAEDHEFVSDETGLTNIGHHKKVILTEQTVDPATDADEIGLYAKDVSGQPELFFRPESDATAAQLTTDGKLNEAAMGPHDIPSGETILFYKDTAVAGYTLKNTLDNKVVYVTKGSAAGGQTGGAVHSTGTWSQPNHNHAGPSHTHTGPSHTHSTPAHTHGLPFLLVGGELYWLSTQTSGTLDPDKLVTGGDTGVGASPYKAVSDSDGSGATGPSGTGATGASGTGATSGSATESSWRPAAYCFTMQERN
jgi:hypothetical protein